MVDNIDKKEPVAICDQPKIDVTKCDNHELAGNIEPLIKVIRGQQVMLDKDLAMLYGVEAKVLNQAVKRNVERFPNDFRFQIDKGRMFKVTNCDLKQKNKVITSNICRMLLLNKAWQCLVVSSVHKQLLRLIFGNNKELTCKDWIVYENIEYSHIKEKRDNT